LNTISEFANTSPFESPLTREWALRLAVKCSLFKSGLLASEVDSLFPADFDRNLWSRVHTLLVSPFSGKWFREAVQTHSKRRAMDPEWRSAQIVSRDLSDDHPISEKFILLAMAVHGRPCGSYPREEMDLLRMLNKEHSHFFRLLDGANTRREAQISLWLRDLASHHKNLMWGSDLLIQIKMKSGCLPSKDSTPILHPALLIN
jgi:hypothetical protein